MGNNRTYNIPFVGLKQGVHLFEYHIEDSFFTEYGEQDFTNCKANVKLNLEKNVGFLQLKFDVGGTVDVGCDRCGNPLNKVLWDEFTIIVKLVDNPEEMNLQEEDPDIFYLGRTESHLQIESWLYEFVTLSIPNQRTCNEEEYKGPLCNLEVLYKLQQMEEAVKKEANPIWKGLESFKQQDN
ncbi:MAG: YceD family protein [Chitinophagaceae bacterium]|jgi:uncharacterized metal-binding protein YceD (DUF177 family)